MAQPDADTERRLTPKGRATRERIVQTAAEVIVGQGLRALNMDAVRQAASVSGSQLAHYFADKSALIRAVVAHQIGVVLDFHRQPKLGGLDTFDDFERWIDLNLRYLRRVANTDTPTPRSWQSPTRRPTRQPATAWDRGTGNGLSCCKTRLRG
jgi:AcrR family transcriptional regulator